MKLNKEKFLNTIEPTLSNTLSKAKERKKNRAWLRKSQKIAILALAKLKEKGISQKKLANQLGVSPQLVSKILSGKQNLTLETITKMEWALGIQLIEVFQSRTFVSLEGKKKTFTVHKGQTKFSNSGGFVSSTSVKSESAAPLKNVA